MLPSAHAMVAPATISAQAKLSFTRTCVALTQTLGPTANCADAMGLLEQESGFNDAAVSSAGARGVAQFTKDTAELMARKYPTLRPPDPHNRVWAEKALGLLLAELMDQFRGVAASPCTLWLLVTSAYNGGPGLLRKERLQCAVDLQCNESLWFGNIETKIARAKWAWDENRDYVFKVFWRAKKYATAGMGTSLCH